MKKICLLITVLVFCTSLYAQKQFDSTAYATFYQNIWEKPVYQPGTSEKLLDEQEKIAGLSKLWAEAKYNFANFDLVPNLNWDSLYQSFIPKVQATQSTEAYYKTLQHFYQYLHDGHTGVSMPMNYYKEKNGILPIEIRWVENKAIVVRNLSKVTNEQAIRPGMELVAFNHVPVHQFIQKEISPYLSFSTSQDSIERIYRYDLMIGKAGTPVTLTFKGNKNKEIKNNVQYIPFEQFFGNYPMIDFKVLKGNIGYLQINSFNDERVVSLYDSLFPAIAKTSGLIIDIRNNGGGNGSNGYEILSSLTENTFYTGKSVIRRYRPVGRAWGSIMSTDIESEDWVPRKKQLYTQPVIVLVSGATYSAAEDFASAFKIMKRGKLMGSTTGGSTGQPITFGLPGGGVARVCAKRDFIWDGTEFIGIGIQPDIYQLPTIKGIIENKDEVLDAALQTLDVSFKK